MNRPDGEEWRDQAACRGYRTSIFVPSDGDTPHAVDPTAAALCDGCPVRPDCLDYALNHTVHGYWGGTSERQRRRLRRLHGIVPTHLTIPDPEPPTEEEEAAS